MLTPSLGELLRLQCSCERPHCLVELEQRAAETSLCAERDLASVKDFFHQAMTQFTTCILSRVDVLPMVLGNGHNTKVASILQTFRWKWDKDIRHSEHPYHGVWTPFQAWCEENDLHPEIAVRRNSTGKEQWHALTVIPSPLHTADTFRARPSGAVT
jgi:hypothetical protein